MNTRPTSLIIDFDSTLVKDESLELLAEKALEGRSDVEDVLLAITDVTRQGMNGDISFPESLTERLKLFHAHKEQVMEVATLLTGRVTDSFFRNKDFFERMSENVYIVSGGFREMILPTVLLLGIKESHVFANEFIYDADGYIAGVDRRNILSKEGGKGECVRSLGISGDICVIGDGYTDQQIRDGGDADTFLAFTENIRRTGIVERADGELRSFDEFISSY